MRVRGGARTLSTLYPFFSKLSIKTWNQTYFRHEFCVINCSEGTFGYLHVTLQVCAFCQRLCGKCHSQTRVLGREGVTIARHVGRCPTAGRAGCTQLECPFKGGVVPYQRAGHDAVLQATKSVVAVALEVLE